MIHECKSLSQSFILLVNHKMDCSCLICPSVSCNEMIKSERDNNCCYLFHGLLLDIKIYLSTLKQIDNHQFKYYDRKKGLVLF